VMRAAAENLTPVTLELGGKSPAIVHRKADLKHAVQRIVFAKVLNAGQTCIAVDYAMVPRELEGRFVELVNAQLDAFLGGRVADNPDFTSIITDRHRARLEQLVADAVAKGARITRYGSDDPASAGKVAPTILQGVDDTMDVMREEIFGPLLPVVPYDTLEQALAWVNARPRPLALYYFDRDERRIDQVLTGTHAGGVCVNDTLLHGAQEDIPFGGVGESGMGAYHGREGFLSLSHAKAVFHQRRIRLTWLFNPPYGQAVRTILKAVVG
ncbi:MAG: aldehyde dehydrogenase family protein, partial [Myxococcales bacterium]|nr:aldehyde dehydrogenase family protein [Myxococcales bacterium]